MSGGNCDNHNGERGGPYDLFLCHNRADKDWVRALAEQVESETFEGHVGGRTLRVFFDEWDIQPGQNVVLKVNEGLAKARYVAVVLSPEMLQADWPTLEWTHLVADDPANRSGRIIPVLRRDGTENGGEGVELPAPFRVLNWLDFRKKERYRQEYQKLIRRVRDLPPTRGRRRRPLATLPAPATPVVSGVPQTSAEPDPIHEVVLGNLLPVESFPGTIWGAVTQCRKPQDVYGQVKGICPALELRGGMLYCFNDLSTPKSVFNSIIQSGSIVSYSAQDWQRDEHKSRWFISLLNKCIRNRFSGQPLTRDQKGRFFFLPQDGQTRRWKNGNDPPRDVAAKKTNYATGDVFWVHHGAWLQFTNLGDRLYLLVDPSYVFTSDGYSPLRGKVVGPLSMQWTGKERNAAMLRHIVFWARTLGMSSGKICLETGAAPIVLSGIPSLARTTRGIEFDHIAIASLLRQVEDELGKAAASMVLIDSDSGEEDGD